MNMNDKNNRAIAGGGLSSATPRSTYFGNALKRFGAEGSSAECSCDGGGGLAVRLVNSVPRGKVSGRALGLPTVFSDAVLSPTLALDEHSRIDTQNVRSAGTASELITNVRNLSGAPLVVYPATNSSGTITIDFVGTDYGSVATGLGYFEITAVDTATLAPGNLTVAVGSHAGGAWTDVPVLECIVAPGQKSIRGMFALPQRIGTSDVYALRTQVISATARIRVTLAGQETSNITGQGILPTRLHSAFNQLFVAAN